MNTLDTSTTAQRARLLAHLRRDSLTTLEARGRLNILHPAGRALELRRAGHNIVTIWTWDADHEGRLHRVARYVLMTKKPEVMQ